MGHSLSFCKNPLLGLIKMGRQWGWLVASEQGHVGQGTGEGKGSETSKLLTHQLFSPKSLAAPLYGSYCCHIC